MTIKRGEHKRTTKFIMKKFNKLPIMRVCWKCDLEHKYLKEVSYPFWCFGCGNMYYLGQQVEKWEVKDE